MGAGAGVEDGIVSTGVAAVGAVTVMGAEVVSDDDGGVLGAMDGAGVAEVVAGAADGVVIAGGSA
jgi:hypothetical protein